VDKNGVEDKTWYFNPNENRCYKCDSTCVQDETTLKGQWNARISCCNTCEWDQLMQAPRCLSCKTTYTGVDTDTYLGSVVTVPDSYMVFNNNPYVLCYRCDRVRRSFH
jgi:hypothetical protein